MTRLLLILAVFSLLPRLAAAQPSETIEYYAHDAIGSIRVVFNPAGTVLARQDYPPFGRQLFTGAGDAEGGVRRTGEGRRNGSGVLPCANVSGANGTFHTAGSDLCRIVSAARVESLRVRVKQSHLHIRLLRTMCSEFVFHRR